MQLIPGARLGPYQIVATLGAGGMGEVYKARDRRLDRIVAIKILPAGVADDPQRQERFRREARAISSLTHAHICTLHDIGEQDGVDFLVMEYLAGETLAHRLLRGAMPFEEALRIGAQLADALDTAHRRGLTHRDLKPANVMLAATGAKVLDFGLAKWHEDESAAPLSVMLATEPTLTQVGAVVGTLQVHGAGAGGGQAGRPTIGSVRARGDPVRDDDGTKGVRGPDRHERHGSNSVFNAAADEHPAAGNASRARPRRP